MNLLDDGKIEVKIMATVHMYMTVEEYMDLEPCGSVHPNHPDVVCAKSGECAMDWHMAQRTTTNWLGCRHTHIIQWGKDLENFVAEVGGPMVGRLLRIYKN